MWLNQQNRTIPSLAPIAKSAHLPNEHDGTAGVDNDDVAQPHGVMILHYVESGFDQCNWRSFRRTESGAVGDDGELGLSTRQQCGSPLQRVVQKQESLCFLFRFVCFKARGGTPSKRQATVRVKKTHSVVDGVERNTNVVIFILQ